MAAAIQTSKGASQTATATTGSMTTTGGSGSVFGIVATMDPSASPHATTPWTDSKSNTYSQQLLQAASDGFKIALALCFNGTGGSGHTFTFTADATSYSSVFGFEITGILSSSALDASVSTADSVSPYTVSSGALSQADEILLSGIALNTNLTMAPGNSFTLDQEETNSSLYWCGAIAHKIVSSTASDGPSWSSAGGDDSALFVVSFKIATSSQSQAPRSMHQHRMRRSK